MTQTRAEYTPPSYLGPADWRDWVTAAAIRKHGYVPMFVVKYVPERGTWRADAEKWMAEAPDPTIAITEILKMIVAGL